MLFGADGVPLYDENEQVFMQDASGAEVGIFKAYSTVRDGEVMGPDGKLTTEKQTVGYIELYQPLGAGAYVLVEIEAPEGYVRSKPIAFIVYSDKVEYYEDGDPQKKKEAVRYQYVRPVGADGKTVTEDMHQIRSRMLLRGLKSIRLRTAHRRSPTGWTAMRRSLRPGATWNFNICLTVNLSVSVL